jgi:Oxidoreductase NAD-binding domain
MTEMASTVYLITPLVVVFYPSAISLTAPFLGFLQHRRALVSNMESKEAASSVVEGTWRGDFEMEEEDLKISKGDASGLSMGADFVRTNLANNIGSVDVFFGCRHEDHDWLYRSDMLQLEREGIISKLHTAFSRDPAVNGSDGNRRKYVQDIMLEKACSTHLAKLIHEKNASIFVCGDGNAMARDVQNALTQIVAQGLSNGCDEAARKYVEKMKQDKRYLVDIWTS